MTGPGSESGGELTSVLVFLILGAGFVAMFLNVSWFWMIWVLGFAVLLPIVSILTGEGDEWLDWGDGDGVGGEAPETDPERDASEDDPLETLRERYARGEIDEEAFERRLEALLETETPEGARERAQRRARERSAELDTERN